MSLKDEIVRQPDFLSGPLTDIEKQKLAEHHNKWMKIATRTETARVAEVDIAIRNLYKQIKQDSNVPIVIVPSPVAMMMVYGAVETIEEGLKNGSLKIVPDKSNPRRVRIVRNK